MVDPTFQNVRQVCEQYEDVLHATSTENTVLLNSSTNSNKKQVDPSKQFKKSTDYRVPQNLEGNSHRSEGFKSKQFLRKCVSCGRLHSRHSCPHRKVKCFKYGEIGHIQTVCRSSNCQLTYDAES